MPGVGQRCQALGSVGQRCQALYVFRRCERWKHHRICRQRNRHRLDRWQSSAGLETAIYTAFLRWPALPSTAQRLFRSVDIAGLIRKLRHKVPICRKSHVVNDCLKT